MITYILFNYIFETPGFVSGDFYIAAIFYETLGGAAMILLMLLCSAKQEIAILRNKAGELERTAYKKGYSTGMHDCKKLFLESFTQQTAACQYPREPEQAGQPDVWVAAVEAAEQSTITTRKGRQA